MGYMLLHDESRFRGRLKGIRESRQFSLALPKDFQKKEPPYSPPLFITSSNDDTKILFIVANLAKSQISTELRTIAAFRF